MIETFEQLLDLQQTLRKRQTDRAAFVAPDYAKLRFKLGTSLAETRVPLGFSAELEKTLDLAPRSLYTAVLMRHRNELSPADLDAVLLDTSSMAVQDLPPESWYLGDVPHDSVFYRIFTRTMRQNRLLDAALLFWWFAKDRPGRQLLNDLKLFLQKLAHEEKERGNGEETVRLGMTAVMLRWHAFKSPISEKTTGPLIQQAYSATAVVLYETLRAVLEDHYGALGIKDRPMGDDAAVSYQGFMVPFSPLAIATASLKITGDAVNPFGISNRTADTLERFFPRMIERSTPVDEIQRQIAAKIAGDKQAPGLILAEVRRQRILEGILQLVTAIKAADKETPEAKILEELHAIRTNPDGFLPALDDKKQFKDWSEKWKRMSTVAALRPQLDAFHDLAAALVKLSPGLLSDKKALEAAFAEHAKRFVLLRHSEAWNEALAGTGTAFQLLDSGALAEAWAQGRAYRLGYDEKPLLQDSFVASEGQFFIDLKDFTKRTYSSKEVAMADFMKHEFYEPILAVAKEYQVGMRHIDRSGISINNLLGDAVSASGDMLSLFNFSKELFAIIRGYREKLRARIPEALVREKVAALQKRHDTQRAALLAERNRLLTTIQKLTADYKAMPAQDPKRAATGAQLRGYQESFATVDRQVRELQLEFADEKGLLEGTGLEAGAYIAWGTAAEMIVFRDEVFGPLKVAIGEKINESARGTARDGGVRSQLEHVLARQRVEKKNPSLAYPFSAYVDDSVQLDLEPDLEDLLRKAIAAKDADGVKRMVQSLSQRLVNDLVPGLKKNPPEFRTLRLGNGIYNLGLALSGDAVDALCKAVEGSRAVQRRTLKVEEFHPEIGRRFAFPKPAYEFVILNAPEAGQPADVFVALGSMVFKGFEKMDPQTIYVYAEPESAFYQAFAKHHLAEPAAG